MKHFSNTRWLKLLSLGFISLAFTLSSCSSSEQLLSRTEQCKIDFKEAFDLLKDEDYFDAREKLHTILGNCTGTGFMEDAQYLLAEAHFSSEEWIEAYSEYNLFINHYPSSPKAPLASYRKGLAAWSQDYVPGRDETYTNDAIKAFNSFVKIYPEHAKIDSAKFYLSDLSERLADREMATAILYLKMKEPQATAIYLQEFITNFPSSKRYGEALALLVESYTRLEQFEQAENYLAMMGEKLDKKVYGSQMRDLKEDLEDSRKDYQEALETKRLEKLKRMKEAN